MISHQHQCVFVHIPKTAGVSVETVFLENLGISDVNRIVLQLGMNRRSANRPINLSHLKAKEYVAWHFLSDELFDSYFKFAFVREPIARCISTYKYLGYSAFCTFPLFVNRYLPALLDNPAISYFVCPQWDYTHSAEGTQLVDHVGKFERVGDEFKELAERLGVSSDLPHRNKTTATPYRDLAKRYFRIQRRHGLSFPRLFGRDKPSDVNVDQATRDAVWRIYEKDFDTFGY